MVSVWSPKNFLNQFQTWGWARHFRVYVLLLETITIETNSTRWVDEKIEIWSLNPLFTYVYILPVRTACKWLRWLHYIDNLSNVLYTCSIMCWLPALFISCGARSLEELTVHRFLHLWYVLPHWPDIGCMRWRNSVVLSTSKHCSTLVLLWLGWGVW